MNHGGDRKQVPLRDYLNSRIAPFLKKAMTQSLEAEAEFPLQWLGECLINQSLLYEGNPDSTKIKERFRYNFDVVESTQEPEQNPTTNGMDTTSMASAAEVADAATSLTSLNGDPQPAEEKVAEEPKTQVQVQEDTVMEGS